MVAAINQRKLKIFISWSGSTSHAVAQTLTAWIPDVIPFVETWFSEEEIAAGEWKQQLQENLKNCDGSIICITSTNKDSHWLNFEVGALALREGAPLIIPFLFEEDISKIPDTLKHYQNRLANKEGVRLLIRDLTARAELLGVIERFDYTTSFIEKFPSLSSDLNLIRENYATSIKTDYRVNAGLRFRFEDIFDDKTNEIIIAAQNMQGLIRGGIFDFLAEKFNNKTGLKVLIILAIPEFFQILATSTDDAQNLKKQFKNTIGALVDFRAELRSNAINRFNVFFHPGVISLTAFFRDHSDKNRGVAVIIPKWATDQQPDSRIFFVIERLTNDVLFSSLYGHIGIMADAAHSKTLDDMIIWCNNN